MIKVVLSYIHFPMAIASYFRAALLRRSDIDLITTGPYTGETIPWQSAANGQPMVLPKKYAIKPDIELPMGRMSPISFVEARLPWEPDLWLQVNAGYGLNGKPNKGINVVIGTDPHVLQVDYQIPRVTADKFYSMQECYMQPGDGYLPYAYDPIWHAVEDQPRTHDVTLLGLHYEQRNRLVDELRRQGVNVCYDLGPVFDEARAIYNAAPIGLNWSSKADLTARVFELLGMRRLAVVNEVPDLKNFFANGVDLIVFRTQAEAVEKVKYYLANEAEADRIAEVGHATVQPHTYDARIEQVLRETGLV